MTQKRTTAEDLRKQRDEALSGHTNFFDAISEEFISRYKTVFTGNAAKVEISRDDILIIVTSVGMREIQSQYSSETILLSFAINMRLRGFTIENVKVRRFNQYNNDIDMVDGYLISL